MTHQPDISKIPESLAPLKWRPMDDSLEKDWRDGQTLLVALPICVEGDRSNWRYEFQVVEIDCDVDRFNVTMDGEPWGWDLDDADYYVELYR